MTHFSPEQLLRCGNFVRFVREQSQRNEQKSTVTEVSEPASRAQAPHRSAPQQKQKHVARGKTQSRHKRPQVHAFQLHQVQGCQPEPPQAVLPQLSRHDQQQTSFPNQLPLQQRSNFVHFSNQQTEQSCVSASQSIQSQLQLQQEQHQQFQQQQTLLSLGQWDCQRCTFKNEPLDSKCLMCETPRPPLLPSQQPQPNARIQPQLPEDVQRWLQNEENYEKEKRERAAEAMAVRAAGDLAATEEVVCITSEQRHRRRWQDARRRVRFRNVMDKAVFAPPTCKI
eukprot:g1596.t1